MRRRLSKKGISDIVANLLMMAMVVALFGMVILWSAGYLGQNQGIWNTQSRRAQEAIVIETVNYVGGPSNNLTVYVRNVGTSNVELNVLYINGTIGGMQQTLVVRHNTGDPKFLFYRLEGPTPVQDLDPTVVSKKLVMITVAGSAFALSRGQQYRLDLFTTLGADAAFIYVVP